MGFGGLGSAARDLPVAVFVSASGRHRRLVQVCHLRDSFLHAHQSQFVLAPR